jgi:hypothetical protein
MHLAFRYIVKTMYMKKQKMSYNLKKEVIIIISNITKCLAVNAKSKSSNIKHTKGCRNVSLKLQDTV